MRAKVRGLKEGIMNVLNGLVVSVEWNLERERGTHPSERGSAGQKGSTARTPQKEKAGVPGMVANTEGP